MRPRRRLAQPDDDDIAWSVAVRARGGGPHASQLLAGEFHRHRELDASRRKRIAETAYGLLRRGRTLEALAGGSSDRRRVILDSRKALDDAAKRDALLATFASLPDVQRIGTVGSLPDWLAQRLIDDFGVRAAESLARALAVAPSTDLRANPAHVDREALITELGREGIDAKPLPRTKFGVRLADGVRDLYGTASFRAGHFEVQDEGSQLIAELVDPTPGSTIIDACAGEGGKTLAMAALLGGRGRIIACDVSAKKLEVLRRRAQRAGAVNVQTVLIERDGPLALPDADRILVDAPCSGIGTLRRNPELRHRIDPDMPARLSREQRAIATRFAAKTDRLIYATCTVLKQEDEESVAAIVAATGFTVQRSLRLFPHVDGTDGFFAAVLQRGA